MTKQTILVVDDDPNLVQVLRLRLLAHNYNVSVAVDGYAAFATAQKERPGLIILDLGLPAGDGFIVLNRLRKRAYLAGVPVIVLSARGPENYEERALRAGAAAYLQKPAENDELLQMIRLNLSALPEQPSMAAFPHK